MTDTERYAHELIFKVSEKCFAGHMPNDSGAIVAAIVNVCFPDAPQEVLAFIVPHLFTAANKHLRMQDCQLPL